MIRNFSHNSRESRSWLVSHRTWTGRRQVGSGHKEAVTRFRPLPPPLWTRLWTGFVETRVASSCSCFPHFSLRLFSTDKQSSLRGLALSNFNENTTQGTNLFLDYFLPANKIYTDLNTSICNSEISQSSTRIRFRTRTNPKQERFNHRTNTRTRFG